MPDVDELYRAPFGEFIARRDALARALRKDGHREEADQVKKLKKPALSAWAINQLPRDAVNGLLAAGAAMRQARRGDTLRDATHDEREVVEDLASQATALLRQAGHPVTDKTAGEIRDTLHAAALDEESRDLLAAGRLVTPRQAVGLFGGAVEPEPARRKQKAESRKQGERAEAERRREEEKARRAALRDAERVVKERERELAAAQKALDQARAALEKLQG